MEYDRSNDDEGVRRRRDISPSKCAVEYFWISSHADQT